MSPMTNCPSTQESCLWTRVSEPSHPQSLPRQFLTISILVVPQHTTRHLQPQQPKREQAAFLHQSHRTRLCHRHRAGLPLPLPPTRPVGALPLTAVPVLSLLPDRLERTSRAKLPNMMEIMILTLRRGLNSRMLCGLMNVIPASTRAP
jgi:hypothetical protein